MSMRSPPRGPSRLLRTVLLLCVAGAGCVAALPSPQESDVARARSKWPGVTERDLAAGRRAYVSRCGGCHHLYLPSSRTSAEWTSIVGKMAEEAQASPAESLLIEQYLVALSGRPPQ